MVSEFGELINSIRAYYGDNFVGLVIYEFSKQGYIGVLIVFKRRSPIMIDDSVRLMNLVKYFYRDAESVAVISLDELRDKLRDRDEMVDEFLRNIVFVHDESGELKELLRY